MDSLAEETWDLVIAGTGLVQALLALSLSRSDLKILHVDENSYYGGDDAGLSLDEASAWAEQQQSARISQPETQSSKLAASRAYTLSLNPQIVYAQSRFLPSLVSSTINAQLEFLAVGSWWIYEEGKLQKVPSSREDVFADDKLSRRDKIGLMKFLRHVVHEDAEETEPQEENLTGSLDSALTSRFKISPGLQLPISSLALSLQPVHKTEVGTATSRIRRHMKSMGYFGPGFGAVLAKYAGNAEIAQVCCRACAVGGATYLLGYGVSDIVVDKGEDLANVTLTNNVTIKARNVVSSINEFPAALHSQLQPDISHSIQTCQSITIVASPLKHLFSSVSENGATPAAAIVLVNDAQDVKAALEQPPIYLQIHSEDTGECPSGQCIIYASTLLSDDAGTDITTTQERLETAVQNFLQTPVGDETMPEADTFTPPEILWSMSFISKSAPPTQASVPPYLQDNTGRILVFPPRAQDIAFNDSVLDSVRAVWERILSERANDVEFLRFEDRSTAQGGDDE